MKIVQQTIASLGSPMWIEPLGMPDRSAAVIARWRHPNGRLQIATADAIRVCLSLSTGQHVRHAERDRSLSKSVLAGDVIVLRPGIPSETTLEGDAELVQIFIEPESLGQVASNPVTRTLVAPPSGALKRAVVRLFVAARHVTGEGAARPKSDCETKCAPCWRHRPTRRGNPRYCHQRSSAAQSG